MERVTRDNACKLFCVSVSRIAHSANILVNNEMFGFAEHQDVVWNAMGDTIDIIGKAIINEIEND